MCDIKLANVLTFHDDRKDNNIPAMNGYRDRPRLIKCDKVHVFNPIMVDNYAAFFNYTPVVRASDYDGSDIKLFILVALGQNFLSVAWPTGVQLVFFFCSGFH